MLHVVVLFSLSLARSFPVFLSFFLSQQESYRHAIHRSNMSTSQSAQTAQQQPLLLLKENHIRYFLMLLRTPPSGFTPLGPHRMLLMYFCVSGLDTLGALVNVSTEQRECIARYIASCQCPVTGGIAASPLRGEEAKRDACLPDDFVLESSDEVWSESPDPEGTSRAADVATLTMTHCGLHVLRTLGVLRYALSPACGLDRGALFRFVKSCQIREDGAFGCYQGARERDVRFTYSAVMTLYLLLVPSGNHRTDDEASGSDGLAPCSTIGLLPEVRATIDVERAVAFVHACQCADGGFSGTPGLPGEGHGGMTYCAVASLRLLTGCAWPQSGQDGDCFRRLLRFAVVRQATTPTAAAAARAQDGEDTTDDSGSDSDDSGDESETEKPSITSSAPRIAAKPEETVVTCGLVGLQGRCNKPCDSCYSFWVGATLAQLPAVAAAPAPDTPIQASLGACCAVSFVDWRQVETFVLACQDGNRGFAKAPGVSGDPLHTCLALQGLAMTQHGADAHGLRQVHPTLGCSLVSAETW